MTVKEDCKPCPVCSGNWGGVGVPNGNYKKGRINRKYLKCPTCGHSWSYDVIEEVVSVNYGNVEVDFQEDFAERKTRSRHRRSK